MKLICAEADRDFAQAEKILATDPKQEFEAGNRRFLCKDYLLGCIKADEGDEAAEPNVAQPPARLLLVVANVEPCKVICPANPAEQFRSLALPTRYAPARSRFAGIVN
ncbi:MAG: hypothetical protein WAM44_12700 [Chthoniobacterales bacterium]